MKQKSLVPINQLRRVWDPKALGFESTSEIPLLEGLVGQDRAVDSLHFGLGIRSPGYNIYVAGPAGTGKTSYSTALIRAQAAREPMADDWVYVHNFDRPDESLALSLPAGGAPAFAHELEELVSDVRQAASRALNAREHQARREELIRKIRVKIGRLMAEVELTAKESGFAIAQTQEGLMPVPTLEGQPLTEEQFSAMTPDEREELSDRGHKVGKLVAEAARRSFELEKALQQELVGLDSQVASQAVSPILLRLKERYKQLPRVSAWLERVEQELVGHAVPGPTLVPPVAADEAAAALQSAAEEQKPQPDPFSRFKVNVFVPQPKKGGAPVVAEPNPTYYNLFGKAELIPSADGGMVTGLAHIKAGSVHRANGGYLILQMIDLARHPGVWEALKRALSTREARIEIPDSENRLFPVHSLRPQPIPLDLKVVLIGSAHLYQALWAQDEGFRKHFKVKAEFDTAMPVTPQTVKGYTGFIAQVCDREKLRHLSAGAVAQVIEHAHRLTEDQQKLSARFNEVVEVIYEANAHAAAAGSERVEARHVDQAIAGKAARSALPELHLQEMIERGTIMVDVDGAEAGQVNGLTVMNVGDHSFGSPCRITARVYTGTRGILHIEREIDMTGQIHDKGLFTLTGYLGERLGRNRPLAFSASIAFEQTYVPVDGDSASSTELYALLSALADAPIDQGIAVTGSVNQRGQVQPIGGVNEKVEGFYRICKLKGLTGRQGVMIPHQNLPNLMLSAEVVKAVRQGRFHVWAVSSIEEGVEILTGVPAGERRADGRYTPGSLFDRVDRRIEELVQNVVRWKAADTQ